MRSQELRKGERAERRIASRFVLSKTVGTTLSSEYYDLGSLLACRDLRSSLLYATRADSLAEAGRDPGRLVCACGRSVAQTCVASLPVSFPRSVICGSSVIEVMGEPPRRESSAPPPMAQVPAIQCSPEHCSCIYCFVCFFNNARP